MPRIARLAPLAGRRRSAEAGVTVERPGWLEIASSPAGYPAAAARVSPGVWRLSERLRGQMASGAYWLTLVDLGGHETGRFTLAIP
jgi:hypothetical protein